MMARSSTHPVKRWLRRLGIVLASVLVLLGALAFVAFRTNLLLSSLETGALGSEREADALLRGLAAAHGTPERWRSQGHLVMRVRGNVAFFAARRAFGLDQAKIELTLRFRPNAPGRYHYVLVDGARVRRGHVDTRRDRDGLGLLLDSVHHLFALPFVAGEIPVRRGMARAPSGEQRAFFTWGRGTAASPKHDQVVLWTRAGGLVRMDTTGRDIAPFIVARVQFEGTVRMGQLRLPARATVYDDRFGRLVQRFELVSIAREPGAAVSHR
ncbi:MAG: hypothetical protein KC503_44355 [Myxococcales bacterium]|nr:hypothetical protein [Myxococcales bacterium]